MHSREVQLSMQVDIPNSKLFRKPNFFKRRGETVSPCEICPIQDSSGTMLIFHIVEYISLVFNIDSQP